VTGGSLVREWTFLEVSPERQRKAWKIEKKKKGEGKKGKKKVPWPKLPCSTALRATD